MANVAGVKARNAQFFAGAAHRFRERNINVKLEIGARLAFLWSLRCVRAPEILAKEIAKARATARALSTTAAKIKSAEIEVDILRRLSTITRSRRRSAARSRHVEPKLVVHLALLRVRKHFVRFLDLLEFFLGRFVSGIQVRVIFPGKLAVRNAKVLEGHLSRHSQQFVIILFCGRRHWSKNLQRAIEITRALAPDSQLRNIS